MKTTKQTVLAKKVQKLVEAKTITKNSLVYKWISEIIDGKKEFRPIFTQGSTWKNSSLVDKSVEFETVLRNLNIDFSISNDSPRGGKTGYRFDINTKVII